MKFSIISINYNNFAGLQKTMQSIFEQSFNSYEYIVIDGGSTDGSKEYIEQHASQLAYWVSEKDKGIYDAMNKGISLANGKYLLFLNSGDYFYSNTVLEKLTNLLNRTESDIYYSDVNLIYKDYDRVRIYPENLNLEFWSHSTLNHQSTVTKKDILVDFNKFSLNFKLASDFNFYLSAFMTGKKFFKIPFIISNYDMNGISSRSHDLLTDERNIILNNLVSPYFKSMWIKSEEFELVKKYKFIQLAIFLNYKWQNFKKFFIRNRII